jgi:HK97 family phage major capsid protein
MTNEEQLKSTLDALGRTFEEFKTHVDTQIKDVRSVATGNNNGAANEKLVKLQQTLDDLTGKKDDLEKRIKADAELREKQFKQEVEHREALEKKVNALRLQGVDADSQVHQKRARHQLWLKAVVRAQLHGAVNLNEEQGKLLADVAQEYKALTLTDDTTGGYLAPVEYVREIIKGVTEFSPVRSIVRVRTTSQKSIQLPKRTAQFAARRTTESGTRTETDGLRFGMVEIDAPEMYALVDISQQNLEDSAFDLESEVRMESEEQFAVKEGTEFVTGSGIGELQGIVTAVAAGEIQTTNSGSAAVIADGNGVADGLISLFHALKTQYTRNAQWILNRTTLGAVRKLKDTQKQYIWQPGLSNGVPNTILGAPYTETPDMQNEGANLYPIGFGDWKRAYTLLDRLGMQLLRDPYTQATSGNIRFLMRRRVGGRVVLGEAVRLLKCST